jgi:energy-coupling factor transporter ATP-binding protein EcfA2
MDREGQISALQADLLFMVADHLTPVALRYGYSDVPLETNIKWRPQVLVIGNYSSGKSTLINEFLGAKIQATGQAPTDDSFTIITYDDSTPKNSPVHITEERDGNYLLNDPEYPFEILKKYGEKFTSHFCLKKVNSPAGIDQQMLFGGGAAVSLSILVLWMIMLTKYFTPLFHKKCLKNLNELTSINNQMRRDSWEAVRNFAKNYLTNTAGRFSLKKVKKEFADVCQVCDKGSQEIREAMKELPNH